ncbi:dihydrofolate reductase family protein [Flavobacterium noncentrifugens]|uniref:Dihydrofolate reductase n=1 Tax=Flavobacterium noncentrifugens TaxID=1128970 RepID=A0A1G8Y433_9FLAO|nr:dihydrofolate reductase family protein [Flavobacterium noncentrifugens]SDJ97433.1 Dihydrofolate reductase [Flavobacterium noncentrifugens]
MRKVIAAINMTLDGVFDHTAGIPDTEIHHHYTELLNQSGVILYGSTTYQLMEFWKTFLEKPSAEKAMNEFAAAIDKIPKIVFSNSLKNLDWNTATLANIDLKETVLALKKNTGKDILIGSRSLIMQLTELNLIDEYQICVYPVIQGNGSTLFENLNQSVILKLIKTKIFTGGSIILYYQPAVE